MHSLMLSIRRRTTWQNYTFFACLSFTKGEVYTYYHIEFSYHDRRLHHVGDVGSMPARAGHGRFTTF